MAVTRPKLAAQPATAGIGEREHGPSGADGLDHLGRPGDGGRAGRVDVDHGDVEVGVDADHAADHVLAVGALDRHLVAAQHVRVGEDAPVGDHDARAAAPAAPEPDHRGPDPLGDRRDGGLDLVQEPAHRGAVRIGPSNPYMLRAPVLDVVRRRPAPSPSKAGPVGDAASPPTVSRVEEQ